MAAAGCRLLKLSGTENLAGSDHGIVYKQQLEHFIRGAWPHGVAPFSTIGSFGGGSFVLSGVQHGAASGAYSFRRLPSVTFLLSWAAAGASGGVIRAVLDQPIS